ncbi:major facilitator superfamily MFS-1 [Paxillus ammoniavirescens]|nr:major facilitator superfamily MFS-1 [Paxillus ammoniavirescens]
MSASDSPTHFSLPPRRSFGVPNALGILAAEADIQESAMTTSRGREQPKRISWAQPILSRLRSQDEETSVKSPASERPPIPSALHAREPASTPLPVLSMVVLSIAMLGEFLSANVAMPFLLFMVKGFNEFEDESDIAFYTGILVAAFFLTQFLTSLLWATVAEKHGRRTVLTLSLFGSAVTVLLFGTCTSLRQAITVRLLQGIFAGAVGVARGCVASVTDVTNEGRAYAIMGFCWGFGGVAGAIIGGSFERPAEKWPEVIGQVPLLVKYPYLLPCAVAGCITLIGSFLSLFLGRDGGPREGAIRLPPEKFGTQQPSVPEENEAIANETLDEEQPPGFFLNLRQRISIFSSRSPVTNTADVSPSSSVPLILSPRMNRQRTSRANGSAYGYNGNYTSGLTGTTMARESMASTTRRQRNSRDYNGHQSPYDSSDLNFTQRLLMANENAVTNIADLWVAAAMNVDSEEQYHLDAGIGSDEEQARPDGEEYSEVQDILGSPQTIPSHAVPRSSLAKFTSPSGAPLRSASRTPALGSPLLGGTRLMRRSSSNVPSIFAHAGVRTPPAVLDAQLREAEPSRDSLTPILERQSLASASGLEAAAEDGVAEKPPSLTSQLPILVIIQYGMLALHSTTHDQIFLSYLVSDYESGGLNLNPGHFSQLIAVMCLFQIVYQFYLYPNIGPPRGRFSHMAMFRLGSLLFIPAYLTVIMYRVFASPTNDGNFILMSALAISTAVRYCGNTFGYTAASILLNYMSPPAAVGFANGVAQSIVSLARCFGPILGGYLWSTSTQNDPSGYPLGFLACAGACALAIAHSFFIR